MSRLLRLKSDERGGSLVEFAVTLPVLVTMIWSIFQCATLYEANAGMQHALGEGARVATLCQLSGSVCTVPSDTTIVAKMNAKLFGPVDGTFNVQTPVTAAGYKTLTITYTRTMNFLFFPGPSVTITRSKKVYTVA